MKVCPTCGERVIGFGAYCSRRCESMANSTGNMANSMANTPPDMANTGDSMANTVSSMANSSAGAYRYRDPDARRAYMREYMRQRRNSA